MATIQAIFDGKTFVPKEPVSLPVGSEVEFTPTPTPEERQAWMDRLNADLRAAYDKYPSDEEDEAWAKGVAAQLSKVWDED